MGLNRDVLLKEEYERNKNKTQEEIEAEEKSVQRGTYGCLIVILVAIFVFVLWLMGTFDSPEPRPQNNTKVTMPIDKVAPAPAISNEKLQEMRTAYTQVLTNTLKPICVDTAIRNESWVNVYVNSLWYELNKGQKENFINQCKNTYAGMLGARGIRLNYDSVIIFVKLAGSEKQVGKWSGVSGITVNE